MTAFEDQYQDVLQNIEFAIVSVYRENPELTDFDVDKILNALIKAYQSEQQQRTYIKPALSPLAGLVYRRVQTMCDWRLGRETMETKDGNSELPSQEPITVEEVIFCLKRIHNSVGKWGKRGGRKGYLQFVDQFIL